MWVLPLVILVTCVAIALRRTPWAAISLSVSRRTFGLLLPLSLLYFPYKAGWHVGPVDCQWTFGIALALHSLRNFPHMVMFAIFFLLTMAQLPGNRRAMAWSFAACLVMGLAVELAEGATGIHHCRMRDLVPDMAGAAIGALVLIAGRRMAMRRRAT